MQVVKRFKSEDPSKKGTHQNFFYRALKYFFGGKIFSGFFFGNSRTESYTIF